MRHLLQTIHRHVTVFCLLAALAAGTANPTMAAERTVWKKLDQYVALEPREKEPARNGVPNDHPSRLSREQILNVLSSLNVIMEDGEKPVALFSEWELEVLPAKISEALGAAGSDEDVVFALVGLHSSYGFFKQSMVTTGRVFITGKRLNLILGQVHEPVNDRDDRRLKPFVPGSRHTRATAPWRIVGASGTPPETADGRPDWIRIVPGEHSLAPHKSPQDNATAVPAVPSSRNSAPPPVRSLEERLRLLKDLHDKKLITDEEFQNKRREILSEI